MKSRRRSFSQPNKTVRGQFTRCKTPVPNRRQRLRFAETALVSLLRRVIVRMHHDRFRHIHDAITLRAAPARVFVVFGVLHFLQKPAPAQISLRNATAYHAEKMIPRRRLTVRAEAPLVIMRKHRLAIGSAEFAARTPPPSADPATPSPAGAASFALRRGVGIQKNSRIPFAPVPFRDSSRARDYIPSGVI